MDEREVRLAMERIRRIEEEARKRLLKEKEKAKESKPKTSKPKSEPAVPKAKESKIPKPPKPKESSSPKKKEPKPPKKKKEPIPAAIKTLVWNKWTGEKEAEAGCYCCRVTTISMRHFHCGHVISESKGGKMDCENLRPICSSCNLSMGSQNMDLFIEKCGFNKN
jgi:5-methylcytosine-specific restriction endonuclease McrA